MRSNFEGNPSAQPQRTYYLYADEGLIAESTQAITLNADGSVTAGAAPQITTQYGPRPNSEFTTGVLFVKTNNSNNQQSFAYLHHDHLQTPLQATDKQGFVVWAASYNAFGKAAITTPAATADKPTVNINLRLPGQYLDEETGLHYKRHRYYDNESGRYVTADPIGLLGGMNRFNYVEGNPLRGIDPSGLECVATGMSVSCSVPGGPKIAFPRPPGWPDHIKPGDKRYHVYNKWRDLDGANKQCVENYIRNNPTPGKPQAATPDGTDNNASPWWSRKANPVKSYLTTDGGTQVVVNVTMPGHGLGWGYVARTVTGGVVNNFGEGVGLLQDPRSPISDRINSVWYGLTDNATKACKCQ